MFKLSPVGKLFFGSLLAWMAKGAALNWKVKGDPKKLEAMAKAIFASKRFQDELKKPGATIESCLEKLNIKAMTAAQYKEITNMEWPL